MLKTTQHLTHHRYLCCASDFLSVDGAWLVTACWDWWLVWSVLVRWMQSDNYAACCVHQAASWPRPAARPASTAGQCVHEPAGTCIPLARSLAASMLSVAADTKSRTRLKHKPITNHNYSVSQKIPPPWFFSDFFPERLGIFSPNFTHLYYNPIYAGLQIFIQLPATSGEDFFDSHCRKCTESASTKWIFGGRVTLGMLPCRKFC